MAYESYVEDYMRETMAGHVLEPVEAGEVPMFWLKRPDSFMYALLVTQLPKLGITLAGDLQIGPGRGGAVMAWGYDIEWFGSELGEGYLCSKFLQEEWSADAAERDTLRRIRDLRRDRFADRDEIRKWVRIARKFKDSDIEDSHGLMNAMWDEDFDIPVCYWPGQGYNRGSAGWLCAAQQRFHELWAARKEEAA